MMKDALILDIQKMSTEDGPGIRTTVFFKGCNLSCAWCHNPESMVPYPEAIWLKPRCMGCGSCIQACKYGVLTSDADGVHIDRQVCRRCMACAEACPTGAMEQKGKLYSPESLFTELIKDRAYFEKSGGGVTLSGGEPLMKVEFAAGLSKMLHEVGIHTALDTAACVPYTSLENVMQHADLLLLDLKLMDDEQHRHLTGHGNALILDNAKQIALYAGAHNKHIWVRTPIIPDATDSEENIAGIARFLSVEMAGGAVRWELCAFNNLCRDKYVRLGRTWRYEKEGPLPREHMEKLLESAKANITTPIEVVWTGAVK